MTDRLSDDRCYRDFMGWYNPLTATPLESAVYELCRAAMLAEPKPQEPPSEAEPSDGEIRGEDVMTEHDPMQELIRAAQDILDHYDPNIDTGWSLDKSLDRLRTSLASAKATPAPRGEPEPDPPASAAVQLVDGIWRPLPWSGEDTERGYRVERRLLRERADARAEPKPQEPPSDPETGDDEEEIETWVAAAANSYSSNQLGEMITVGAKLLRRLLRERDEAREKLAAAEARIAELEGK